MFHNFDKSKKADSQVKEVKSDLESPDNVKKTNIQVKEVKSDLTSPERVNSAAESNQKNMSSSEAHKKLKSKLKAKGIKDQLRPIPKGRAQFIIGHTQGKTRKLLTFYDSGCFSVLFREGVAEKELAPAVRKTRGPFFVNGVGDTEVKVNSEWACSISLVDGTRQCLEGWSVDKITAPLPLVSLEKAEADIKASLPDNEELQKLGVDPIVGGEVDILLGITHNSIFPTSIHSLPNGLTIYKLQISPFDKRYNCAIGGPHESFQFLAEQAGSTSLVFANLMRQLENYKQMGPPKVNFSPMTVEEQELAIRHKEWGMEKFSRQSLDKAGLEFDVFLNKKKEKERFSVSASIEEAPAEANTEEKVFEKSLVEENLSTDVSEDDESDVVP